MEVFVVYSTALDVVENIIGVFAHGDDAGRERIKWMEAHPGLYAYVANRLVQGGAK
jgi:hypothetical protein